MQDDDFLFLFPRVFFQVLGQEQFFSSKQFSVKAAGLAEGFRLNKNERTRQPPFHAAGEIPHAGDYAGNKHFFIQSHSRTASETMSGTDLLGHVCKKLLTGMRVRIDKDKPVSRSR